MMANKVYANMMEVSCKAASGKTICAFPDVCMTPPMTPATPPGVPIPYPNTGMATDATDGSTSVQISGKEIMLKNKSSFSKSSGDEAGSAPKKGVVTSKNMGKVFFNMWSMDVKVEGENVVRHLDITTHNHASMPGNSPPMPHMDGMAPPAMGADTGDAPVACPATGSPVNPILGAKILAGEEDLDFRLEGPLPLNWQRLYRSTNERVGWFGRGWGSVLEVALEEVPDARQAYVEQLVYVDPFGRRIAFEPLAPGQRHFSAKDKLTLIRDASGAYLLESTDGLTYVFALTEGGRHRLTRFHDRFGNAFQLTFFPPRADQAVVRLDASGGQVLQLLFERARLIRVDELRSAADGTHQAVTLVSYAYDARGDLASVTGRDGQCRRRFAYTEGRLMAHQVFAETFEAWYAYEGEGGHARVVKHWDNVGRTWHFDYLPAQTVVRDQDGRETRYHFNETRRWTGLTNALGQFTAMAYDKHGNVRVVLDPAENFRETKYDERGNPVEVREPDGAVTTLVWHPVLDLPVAVTDPDGRVSQYEYDEQGRLLVQVDPSGGQTKYGYDDRGLPVLIEDANGGKKQLAYNARGQLLRHTDCSGHTTEYSYNPDGWLTAITDALGQRTSFVHDSLGRTVRQTLSDGSFEEYEYDAAGGLAAVTVAGQARTQYQYTPDGLLQQRTDPLGHVLRYEYNAARQLVALVNENGARYTFAYDALDRVIHETRFDGVQTRYHYDQSGFVDVMSEGFGSAQAIVTRFTRDPVGRVLARQAGACHARFQYNASGQVLVADNGDALVRLQYDKGGRLAQEAVSIGAVTSVLRHAYDDVGNRIETTLPNGAKLGSLHYGSGHVHQIRLNEVCVTDIERDALHREILRTQGRVSTARRYDVVGRLQTQVTGLQLPSGDMAPLAGASAPLIERQYEYDQSGRLSALMDRGRRSVYAYDAADRLTRFDDQRFAFDPAHNLLEGEAARGRSAGLIQNNRLMVFEDKRYQYDELGRVIEKRIGSHTVLQLRWNEWHRLAESDKHGPNGTQTVQYLYDAFGRRVVKRVNGQSTFFVWDGNRLLQRHDQAGEQTFIYEPESFVPLALAVRSRQAGPREPQLYYYHCDQIGLPRELSDDSGHIVWEGQNSAWGRTQAQAQTGGPDQCLRLQGQYHDEETGLHYNLNRYYDPDSARYVSPDPIGLRGGENAYRYAPNATDWIDPLGLSVRKELYPTRVRKATKTALVKKRTGSDGVMHCAKCDCVITAANASVEHDPPLVQTHNSTGFNVDQATRNDLYNQTAADLNCLDCQKKQGGQMSHCENYREDTGPNFKPRPTR